MIRDPDMRHDSLEVKMNVSELLLKEFRDLIHVRILRCQHTIDGTVKPGKCQPPEIYHLWVVKRILAPQPITLSVMAERERNTILLTKIDLLFREKSPVRDHPKIR